MERSELVALHNYATMEQMLIEVANDKTKRLIQDLEELNLVRVLSGNGKRNDDLVNQLYGSISDKTAEGLHKHVQQSRDEWERDFS